VNEIFSNSSTSYLSPYVFYSVMIVEPTHSDYISIKDKLKCFTDTRGIEKDSILDRITCEVALEAIVEVAAVPDLLGMNKSSVYTIRKDSLSLQGATIEDLATFAALEIRLMKVEKYMRESFSHFVLRERQDSRVRYEISGKNLKISNIFSSIEDKKDHLQLADYSVSQTSLEQVFNMHAAEAELHKTGRIVTATDCSVNSSPRNIKTIESQLTSRESSLKLNDESLPFDERDIP
jgi:hypothetical protein